METQQMMELLLAKMDSYHEEIMAMLDANHERTMACLGKTEADTEKPDPDSGMMQSAEEHQEFTMKDAAVIPVEGRKKQRRARKPAAGRCGEPKELPRSDCGSGKHLAAACRKVSRRATVAWHRRNLVRRSGTQENCGPLKGFSLTGIRMTRYAKVAWRKTNSQKRSYLG
jgi:hypothetical protein